MPRRGLRRVTIRFANVAHKIVEDAAARECVPLAQYVREAALMRVTWEHGLLQSGQGEFEITPETWLAAIRELRALVEAVDAHEGEVPELTTANGDS